jgi:hypothetical protein
MAAVYSTKPLEQWQQRRGCSRTNRKPYLNQLAKQQRRLVEIAENKRAFKARKQEDSPSNPPAESCSDLKGPERHELSVPMRGIDEWVLWSYLERMFGDDTKFSVVVSGQGSGKFGMCQC